MDHGSDTSLGFLERLGTKPISSGSFVDTFRPSKLAQQFDILDKAGRYISSSVPADGESGEAENPNQFKIVNRLTSAIMLNSNMAAQILDAWDSYHPMPEQLYYLIDQGIHFHGELQDTETFWALHRLSANHTQKQPKIYLILALYLYLADTVSRFPNNPTDHNRAATFLEACRNQGFALSYDKDKAPTYNRETLKTKFINVLQELGIYNDPNIRNLVEDWYGKGTFTLDDGDGIDVHDQQNDMMGTYVILAYNLCRFNTDKNIINDNEKVAQLATAIAYALGNKHNQYQLPKLHDNGLHSCIATMRIMGDPGKIAEIVKQGDKLKLVKMVNQIRITFPDAKRVPVDVESKEMLREAILGMPPEIGEPLQDVHASEGDNIAYFHAAKNLHWGYPKQDLPGRPHAECEATRNSAGARLPRYYTIMIADGVKAVNEKWPRETLVLKLRQTLAHEWFHTLLSAKGVLANEKWSGKDVRPNDGHLPGSIIRGIKENLMQICGRIDQLRTSRPDDYKKFFGATAIAAPEYTIGELLSQEIPKLYTYTQLNWEEEACANVVGFMAGQCAPDLKTQNNPFNGAINYADPQVVNELRSFCSDLKLRIVEMRDIACGIEHMPVRGSHVKALQKPLPGGVSSLLSRTSLPAA